MVRLHPGQQVARTCALVSSDIVDLALGDLPRGVGMLHLEGTAAAAAVVGARQFHVLHTGNGLEDVPGLGADLLPLHEMAGIVVGDPDLLAVRPSAWAASPCARR